jgi:CheY-like chemotaxis protein
LQIHPEKVLLVDDNMLLLASMKRFFERECQDVIAVNTGEAAILNLQTQSFDLVLLDINLPDTDGWHVLEHIRNHSPHSKVVVISSIEAETVRETALQKGAVEFIEKPFDIVGLRGVLSKIYPQFDRGKRVYKTFKVRFGAKYKGITHDLSATGMLVMTNVLFECGSTLEISLNTSGDEYIPLKGRVVRTTDRDLSPEFFPPASKYSSEEVKYGVGIYLTEHSPEYPSFFSSLQA